MPQQATAPPGTTAAEGGGAGDIVHARRWWILAVLGFAQLMIVLDITVVNIALPSAQRALHFSNNSREWIVTAYALTFGGLLLAGGRLGDLFGRKRLFVASAIGFGAASALGGAAQSFGMLVAARALQGMFAALMAPAALSLVSNAFTDLRERGAAFGIWGAIGGGGAAIGLLLGGVLTQDLSWRWTLFVNLAFALIAAAGSMALLRRDVSSAREPIDVPGTLTATAGLFALVYGFAYAQNHSWGSTITVACLAAGALLIAVFVAIQTRAAHPLLPPRVVLDRNRAGSYLALGIAGLGLFGIFLFSTYYLQTIKGYSPTRTGLAFLPLSIAVVISAGVANARIVPRTGPRLVIASGMALAALAMGLLAHQVGVHADYVGDLLPAFLVLGVGVGLLYAPATDFAVRGVEPGDAGVASGLINATNQVGGSLGLALLSTLAATATTHYLAGKQPNASVIAHAAVHGYTTGFWWAAGFFAAGALITGLLLHGRAPHPALQPESGAELQPAGAN
ncbi:MAG TPA: MFS transporter [Solirubrobacteraceae bacterium]|nr:MFS transporter [Solirubrobacteraceae bacterium]